MPLNHTFSITMCNTKLVLKLALLMFLLALLAFAVLYAVVNPVLSDLMGIIRSTDVDASAFINHPFTTTKTQFIDKFAAYFSTYDNLAGLIVGMIAVYVLLRFFIFLPQLPVTKVLYSKMSSGYDVGLLNAFIAMGLQNLLLSFLLSLFASVMEIGLGLFFGWLATLCIRAKIYVVLPFLVLAFIAAMAVKTSMYLQWFPEICASEQKNIFVGIKNSFKSTFTRFRKNFLCLFTLYVIGFAIVTATAIPSLLAVPLVMIPVGVVSVATLSLTLNFSFHGKKYFVNNGETVYTPTKLF